MRLQAVAGSRRFDGEILRLALPALGALAADPLISLVDTAWVGRLGARPLAALGVAAAIFGVVIFLFNFLAYGTTPLVADAHGRRDLPRAGELTSTALLIAGAIGVSVGLLLLIGAPGAVAAMGARGGVADSAVEYLRIRALAVPAMLVIVAGHGVFRGFQDTRTPFWITGSFNVVNLVLDPVLIFGLDWGIAGAAWATVVAQWVGAAWFAAAAVRRLPIGRPGAAAAKHLLSVGRDLVLRTAALLATFTLATAVATRVGAVAVAAHQVAIQLWIFLALAIDAVAIAAQAMVARYVGMGLPGEARRAMRRLLWWGTLGGVALGTVMAALAPVLPALFSSDDRVQEAVRAIYPFVVVLQPLSAIVYTWDGIVIGSRDFGFLALGMLGAAAAASVVIGAALPAGWGLNGVWWGVTTLMVARGLTMLWWHRSPRSPHAA